MTGVNGDLYITGDETADAWLRTDPFALLIGMLLDQQSFYAPEGRI